MSTIINSAEAASRLSTSSEEFAVVKNPEYIHPAIEYYPLARKSAGPVGHLCAAVMDMDGTTTTTEELCIHSLEFMIRAMSGRMTQEQWPGLDHASDYPHIIGNSTTKHVEYLIRKYRQSLVDDKIKAAYLHAAAWTLIVGKDAKRREDVALNISNFGLNELYQSNWYISLSEKNGFLSDHVNTIDPPLPEADSDAFPALTDTTLVTIGIDIYYQRYHQILERIKRGESAHVSLEIFNDRHKHLIQPMPGVLIFLSLVKGWLGEEAALLVNPLISAYEQKTGTRYNGPDITIAQKRLRVLGTHFENRPMKTAIVTSSIFYEADIVMQEVFSVLSSQLEELPISEKRKEIIRQRLSHYRNVYDAFITASDSSEIRLKPHRDLYSIALHHLNIPKKEFDTVIGFEDSESGTIAIRAAGIGLCVAVPFAQTSGHNLTAAAHVCRGGLPETLLMHNLFMMS